MRNPKRKIAAVLAITLGLVGVAGGTAYAYWTSGGAGTGSVTTGTIAAATANQTTVISGLQPGGTAQSLGGNFSNPNTTSVHVDSVTVSISSLTGGTPVNQCTDADYVITNPAMSAVQEVAPTASGTTTGSWSGATIAFKNDTTRNQDACKSATVNLSYSVK